LKTRFVALTAGLVKPSTLIWKGRSSTAPEIPPIEEKKDTPKATSGGSQKGASTPETGKVIAGTPPTYKGIERMMVSSLSIAYT
jgi:hypothetical protein